MHVQFFTAAQGHVECTVNGTEMIITRRDGRWRAGVRGTTPTLDVTDIIHDHVALSVTLQRLKGKTPCARSLF